MSSATEEPLLQMAEYHLSPTKARDHVIRLLKATGARRPAGDWADHSYTLQTPTRDITLNFREMVAEARQTGRVESIQNLLDSAHPIFGGTFGMAVSSPSMTIGIEFAGYKKHLKGPARNYPVEQELAEDILECRRLACEASTPGSFALTVRFYRFYLFCCVALLDAFVNRFIHIGKHQGVNGDDFPRLCESRNAEERIEFWVKVFGNTDTTSIKKGVPWDHFQKLRQERNRQIHAMEPFLGYRIAQLPKRLNYCREGVGGLLLRMLQLGKYERHSLFERLQLAPAIRYVGRK